VANKFGPSPKSAKAVQIYTVFRKKHPLTFSESNRLGGNALA